MTDLVRALRRRLQELQDENAVLRTERDIARIDRQCAVAELAHAYQLTLDPGEVPAVLVHALRSASPHPLQRVHLTAAGHDLRVLVDGAGYDADLSAETAVWAWLVEHAAAPPEHPFARSETPARLYGVAWPGGQVTISCALSGADAAGARRALRAPRRGRGLLRALGLLLIPAGAAGRLAAGLARDAQTAATAAASATTTAATTAMPAVTAVAISCTTLAVCSPPVTVATARPPAGTAVGYGATAPSRVPSRAPTTKPDDAARATETVDEETAEPAPVGCCPAQATPAERPAPSPTVTPSPAPATSPDTDPTPEPSTSAAAPSRGAAGNTPAPKTRPTSAPAGGPKAGTGHPGYGHGKGRRDGRARERPHNPPGHTPTGTRGHGRS
jgi:hypothetical protein